MRSGPNAAQGRAGIGVGWVALEGAFVMGDRLVDSAEAFEGDGQVVVDTDEAGVGGQGSLVVDGGAGEVAGGGQGLGEVVVGFGGVGMVGDGAFEPREGSGDFAHLGQCDAGVHSGQGVKAVLIV